MKLTGNPHKKGIKQLNKKYSKSLQREITNNLIL